MCIRINNMSDLQKHYQIQKKVIDYLDATHMRQGTPKGFLTELQKTVFSNHYFWDDSQNVIVQGRTSSGKTLLAQVATAYFGGKEAENSGSVRKKVIYLVPLRAMVNEKKEEFKKIFGGILGWRVYASSSDYQDHDEDIVSSEFEVAVIVYEKFFALLAQDNQFIRNCGLIIVDELQMMNDDSRGPKLEIALTKVLAVNYFCKILGLTTTQCNVEQIRMWLSAEIIISNSRPKALEEYVVWPAVSGDHFCYYMREESEDGDLKDDRNDNLEVETIDLGGYYIDVNEKTKYIEEKMIPGIIRYVRKGREDRPPKIIVFINNKSVTQAIALEICNHLPKKENYDLDMENEQIQNLIFSEDEYAERILNKTLPYGVAFHHGGFSWALREFVEGEFRKDDGMIDIVVATETLAIGVNMPADIVILAGIASPRTNHLKAEMNSHEYKNYIGRAGRLGKSSDTKGRSYLLAPTNAKANDYWNRYLNAREVKISSALHKLTKKEQVPFFFNLIGSSINDDVRIEMTSFNALIKKTMAYCQEDIDKLPGESFIEYLKEYGLIEWNFGHVYSRSRIGNELASYALSLDSVEIIVETCQTLSEIAVNELTHKENLEREEVLNFIERHYLDILFCISKATELTNLFVNNFDEMTYTKRALKYAKKHQDKLVDGFPLKEILKNTFEKGKPMPSLSNSFALKRAIAMLEWMDEKLLRNIREETGLSYVSLGDLDRLGDVFAYIWEAMARLLPVFFSDFAEFKIMLMRLTGRLKYGVGQDLIVLASRHVQYVTRNQLIDLKKEAISDGLSPEQYVRDVYYITKQKALRMKQFQDLMKALNDHYHSTKLRTDMALDANALKQADIMDNVSCTVVKNIQNRKELKYSDVASLFKLPNCNINIKEEHNYVRITLDRMGLELHLFNKDSVSRDAFYSSLKLINEDEGIKYIFIFKEGFNRQVFEEKRKQNHVFISMTAFAKLYLLSLKKTSSLKPFFRALCYGYFFVPEGDMELSLYLKNFIPESEVMIKNEGREKIEQENEVLIHVVQDKGKCSKKVESFLGCLKELLPNKMLKSHFLQWSDTIEGFTSEILKDESSILVFIDEDFENEWFISKVVEQLVAFIGSNKKILMLYQNTQSQNTFFGKHPNFKNLNGVCLDKESCNQAARRALEVLSEEDIENV